MKKESSAQLSALKGLAKTMAKLQLDRVKGYKKAPTEEECEVEMDEEDEDEDMMKVLDAKAYKK